MPPTKPLLQLVGIERSETFAERVYEQLRQLLLTGRMRAGERMTVRALATGMDVSTTPVREALSRLVAEGALEFGPNRTIQVPLLDAARAGEIYDIRVLLEGMLAETAIDHLSCSRLPELEQIVEIHDRALDVGDFGTSVLKNFEFKFALYESAGLTTTLQIVEGLWLRTGPHVHLICPTGDQRRVSVVCHRDAIEALRKGDRQALKSAIQQDLVENKDRMQAALRDDNAKVSKRGGARLRTAS